MFLFTNVRE